MVSIENSKKKGDFSVEFRYRIRELITISADLYDKADLTGFRDKIL